VDQDVFLKHMGAPGASREGEFCSAFMVNALLSNACVSLFLFFFVTFQFVILFWLFVGCFALGVVHIPMLG
jgi:hypothetical protein